MENIIFVDNKKLQLVKDKIAQEGPDKFHVISDFDRTLTRVNVDGREVPSMISILRDGNYLTPDYVAKAQVLFDKYHKIEIDPSVPAAEQKKFMYEWWSAHFKLLIESKLNKKDLEKVANSGKIRLRDGVVAFIQLLQKNKIPLVIFSSSGLGGEPIKMLLQKEGIILDNIHIVANEYRWDGDGFAIGVKEPIIHGANKDETAINQLSFFKEIELRKNVLLLGDSPSDVGMAAGLKHESIIKVCFLGSLAGDKADGYKKFYDVLILNDGSMDYVNALLKEIIGIK